MLYGELVELDSPVSRSKISVEGFHAFHGSLLQFSEDDRLLVAGIGDNVCVYDLQNGSLISVLAIPAEKESSGRFFYPHARSVSVSTEAGVVAAGDNSGWVSTWSLEDARMLSHVKGPGQSFVAFFGRAETVPRKFGIGRRRAPQYRRSLLVGSGEQLAVWDARGWHQVSFESRGGVYPYVECVSGSTTGTLIAATRDTNAVYLFQKNLDHFRVANRWSLNGAISRVLFSRDSTKLYVATSAGGVILSVPELLQIGVFGAEETCDVGVSGDSSIIASSYTVDRQYHGVPRRRNSLAIWQMGAGHIRDYDFSDRAISVAISNDARVVAARVLGGQVFITRAR